MRKLQPAAFNRLLAAAGPVGQPAAWRRSFACPCANPNSGSGKPDCPACHAKGRTWSEEEDGDVGASAQAAQKAFEKLGVWEPGDVMLTIPSSSPIYKAGQYDRIRLKQAMNPFSMVIVPDLNDRIIGSIVQLDRLFWLDDAGEPVEGALPSIDDAGVMTWTAGQEPPDGKQFSISGIRHDEYYVFRDLTGDRNAGTLGLPRKLHARRFDLFAR